MTLLTMSADSHVTEPGDCYLDRIDPRFRDRAPRAITDDVMGAVLLIDEGKSRIPYGMVAAAGRPADKIGPFEYVPWEELHAGGWDPQARLAEQARDGVASEVLYPSAGMLICNMDDADYKKACFDAYNLWIAEFQATSPSRVVGVGQSALRSVAEGVDDLHRIRDLGLRGVMMPGMPACIDEVGDYDDPAWDPLWEAAVGLRLPLSFHILTARSTLGSADFRGPKMNSFLGILRANQDIVGTFVFGGVFDRHPELQIVCVEADAGWVPHWAYRADHAAKRHSNWLTSSMVRPPSEYLFENVSFTFQDDWTAFKVVDQMNHRKLLWASDHPHSDATWPDSQALLAEHTAGMSPEVRDDIVWRNCARLYGMEAEIAALAPEVTR
jgi:predicted TIM-barrel fold metal-dependent hydrolase